MSHYFAVPSYEHLPICLSAVVNALSNSPSTDCSRRPLIRKFERNGTFYSLHLNRLLEKYKNVPSTNSISSHFSTAETVSANFSNSFLHLPHIFKITAAIRPIYKADASLKCMCNTASSTSSILLQNNLKESAINIKADKNRKGRCESPCLCYPNASDESHTALSKSILFSSISRSKEKFEKPLVRSVQFRFVPSCGESGIQILQAYFQRFQSNFKLLLDISLYALTTALKFAYVGITSIPMLLIIFLMKVNLVPSLLERGLSNLCWDYFYHVVELFGPTLIKMLQWAGTRKDIFSKTFCSKCERFHYCGVIHPFAYTDYHLRKAFGDDWKDQITIDPNPIGSGCVAQVYRGYIRNKANQKQDIVIKVKHPSVDSTVRNDLYVLRLLSKFLSWFQWFQWFAIEDSITRFSKVMESQLNFNLETQNLLKFNANFAEASKLKSTMADRGGTVSFPTPLLDYCSHDVMVMSFEEGIHLGEYLQYAEGVNSSSNTAFGEIRKKSTLDFDSNVVKFQMLQRDIGFVGLMAFFKMLLLDNFVHLDLHPGNILIQFSEKSKSSFHLVFLDCGLTESLEPTERKNLIDIFLAILSNRGYEAGSLLLERARRSNCTAPHEFCTEMDRMISSFRSHGKSKKEQIWFGRILYEALRLSKLFQIELDPKFISVVCGLLVLDGVGHQLDPTLDILSEALPFRSFLFPNIP